jgi:4-aminobutyrate aminotransferase
MLVLGKGLGGGVMPLAALLAREDLDIAGHLALGHYTHEKSPLACAAGLATLDYITEHKLVEHAHALGEHALARFHQMQERHAIIGDVRGVGLLLGIELVKDRRTKEPARDEADAVLYAALSRGLSFKLTMGNIITLTPPLTISREELDRAIDILEECLSLVVRTG